MPSHKKVLFVTMHRGYNYGSALQAYALSESIKSLGHIPMLLDYIPERINFHKNVKSFFKSLIGLKNLSFYSKYNAIRGLAILIANNRIYNRFFKANLSLVKADFIGNNRPFPEADIYMTGSDQVWNSFHNKGIDETFFLSFAPDSKPKVAYAASFGKNELEEWEKEITKQLLKRYQKITVRETSALPILQDLDISNAECVLDPTLLLDKDEWSRRATYPNNKERYVLIYSVEPDKNSVIKCARQIADSIGAKVYMCEWSFRNYPGVDKMIYAVDPLKLVGYFLNADFIVASSFHGTAFSINLNKPFISLAPARFNSRVKSILKLIGESSRLVSPANFNLDMALQDLDYNEINKKLERMRDSSRTALKDMLNL